MIAAYLTGNRVVSSSQDAFSLYEKSRWGEKKQNRIEYSLIEALALIESGRIKVNSGKKEISPAVLEKKAKRFDKRIETKLRVFADLRKRGYIVKTALKFGAEFRVYDKGAHPGKDHAPWLLFPFKESETVNWYDFAAKNRVATSTKKKILLAIVDDEDDITYYEVAWFRP